MTNSAMAQYGHACMPFAHGEFAETSHEAQLVCYAAWWGKLCCFKSVICGAVERVVPRDVDYKLAPSPLHVIVVLRRSRSGRGGLIEIGSLSM